MKWQTALLAPAAAMALAASPAIAADSAGTAAKGTHQQDASIPFANSNVRDWRAVGDSTVYFEDNQKNWYKATLFGPAFDLPFTEAIGIIPGPTGALDQFGAVMVRGQRYQFRDFVRVAGPPPGKKTVAAKSKPKTST